MVENGQIVQKAYFKENKLADSLFTYYPDGQLKSKGRFVERLSRRTDN